MRRFLASCFHGDAAELRVDKGKSLRTKADTNDDPSKCRRPPPKAGFVHPSNDLPMLDRDGFLSTVGHLQGAAVAAAIVVSEDPSGKAAGERHGLPHLQSVWMHSHSGLGQAGQKAAVLLAAVQPLLGGLGDLLARDELLRTGLEAAARCALERQYCRVRHRLRLGEEGLQLPPGAASAAHAVVEIGSCVLALGAKERKPGVLVVVKAAPEKPGPAAAPGTQRVSPRPRALGPYTERPAAASTERTHSTPAAKAAPAAAATATPRTSSSAHGGKAGTAKCPSSAMDETELAARAIAAESIPAIMMAIVFDRLGEPDVMVYANQQGREYLGLEAGKQLPRVGCRGLLLLLLEGLGMSLGEILSEASKEQGFTAMIRAPAEVDLCDWALGSGDGGGGGLLGRSGTLGESLLCGVAPHTPMNGIAECPSRDELEEEEEQEPGGRREQAGQEGQEAELEQEPRKDSARFQSEAPQDQRLKLATGRGFQTLIGASMDRQASLSISEGHVAPPLQSARKASFTLTSRLLQRSSITSSTGMTSRADSFALTTPQDSVSHGHPGAGSLLAEAVRQRYAFASAPAAAGAAAAAAAAQDDITDQQLLQRLANTTVAKQARDVCFQNTPSHYTPYANSRQASSSLEKQDSVAAASRRGQEAAAGAVGVGSGAGGLSAAAGAGSIPSGNPSVSAQLESSSLCSQPTPSSMLAMLVPSGLAGADSTPILRFVPTAANGEGVYVRPVTITAATSFGAPAPVLNGQGHLSGRARKPLRRVTTAAAGELVSRVAADALKSGISGGVSPAVWSPPRRTDVSSSSFTSGPAGAAGSSGVSRLKAYCSGRRLGQQGLGSECCPDEAAATPEPHAPASPEAPSARASAAIRPAPGSCSSAAAVTSDPSGAEPVAAAQATVPPSGTFPTQLMSRPAQRHESANVGGVMPSTLSAPTASSLGTPSGLLTQSSLSPLQAGGMGAKPAAAAAAAAAAAQAWQDRGPAGPPSVVPTAVDSGAATTEGTIAIATTSTTTTTIATATTTTSAINSDGAPEVSAAKGRRPPDLDVIRTFCCSPASQPCDEPNSSPFERAAEPLPYDGKHPGADPDTDSDPDSLPAGLMLQRPPSLPAPQKPVTIAMPTTAAAAASGASGGASQASREQVGSNHGGGRHLGNSQGWSATAYQVLGPGAAATLVALSSANGVLSSALHSSNGSHQPPGAGWLQACPMAPSSSSGQWPDLSGRRNSGMLPPMAQALATGSSLGNTFRCRSMGQDASSHGCSRAPSGSLRHPGASLLSSVGFDGGTLAERCMWDSTVRAEALTRMQRSSLDQQRPQHQYQQHQQHQYQHQHQQLSKLGASAGGDQAGAIGSGDTHLLSRGQGASLRSPISGPPSANGTLPAVARPGSSSMRQFAGLSSGPVPGAGGGASQLKRPHCIRTRLFSLLEQMDGGCGMGAPPYPAGSLLAPAGSLRVGSVPARRASAVTSPTMPPRLRQHSARRASTTVLENGGGANLSCNLKQLMELGVSGGGSHFIPGSLCGASDGHNSAAAHHSATANHGRESLVGIGAGMSTSMSMGIGMGILPASSALSANGRDSSIGMIPMPGIGGPMSNGSEASATLLDHMSTAAAPVVSASASVSVSAAASGAGGVGRGGGGVQAGGVLLEQNTAVQAIQALQRVAGSGAMQVPGTDGAADALQGEPGTAGRTSSLDMASRPASQSLSVSQSQNQHHVVLSRSPSLMPETKTAHATTQSSLGTTPSYPHMQHLQQQQQSQTQPQLMQLQAHLQSTSLQRAASGCSTPFVCPPAGGLEATTGGGAGGSGGDTAGAVTGEVPAESPRASAAAAAAATSGGGGLPARMAWFRTHLRAISAPNGGGWTLLLMMQDLTLQVTAQEKITTLLGHEHKILEALFPRHVIEFMTVIPLGLQEDAPRSRPARNDRDGDRGGDCDGNCELDGEPEAGEDLRCSATTSHVRQLIVQQQLDVIKVSHLATQHKMVTILFSDCVGFTAMCKEVPPYTVMHFLNELYKKLDALLDIYKVYKVETIGDCYVVAGGLVRYDADGYCSVLPEGETDELHAVRVMEFAKAMLRISREVMMPTTGEAVQLRLGLHSGPAMSGVVGSKMPRFTVFGETVEAAHKMESSGRPGRIHVSGVTRELLRREQWEQTEGVQIDGGGRVDTYLWLEEEQEDVLSKQRVLAVYI